MRFAHPDGSTVHLAYCTNVHPAETLDGVLAQLRDHCEPVRRLLGRDRLGIGLWLAREAAADLVNDAEARRVLRGALDTRGLEVVTLNGFPYRGFGGERVKYAVYTPDWTSRERLDHTADLAAILADLLPEDAAEGTISTLPLAWREPFTPAQRQRALGHLTELSQRLDDLAEATGRSLRIALEPEPGCTVETTEQAADVLTGPGAPPSHRVGVCLDTCHLATQFEDPDRAIEGLTGRGVPIVKSQLSAALHAEHPGRPAVRSALADFAEPRFLHQTRERVRTKVTGRDDLDTALFGPDPLPGRGPWRVHLHVPLHAKPTPPLTSTLPQLTRALTLLVGGEHPLTHHLEVETYTWQVLPPALRPRTPAQLAEGIAAELALARDLLTGLGLKELT
ncbi:metabolite traffic protein EboE [Streptomyces sp. SBT349]|uniref:metabolite traffic protein EboE n=1 Tax=Streptomyces sp. SBT349 TaxID=1580539 RepID=UPI00066EEC1E|nr:metabolite traffic protein EboE [Streptomyces sp. SBT349]